ncbi:MAG: putative hydrolase of the superfamily, partial [Bradyrhizobium sp.]|nr:putative hydrolase of the superfamily [Bradyrhizobium sp.]
MQSIGVIEERRPEAAYALPMGEVKESHDRRGVWVPAFAGTTAERFCETMKNTSRSFTDIDTWVFDLDNTLYPHHVNLWQQVDVRIGEFVSAFLGVSAPEARRIQKDYYRRYGTTMRGMMTEHGVRADDYLAYVHQIDHSPLEPNPAMGAAIAKLPGRKLILTNGSTDHADKVLERLGIGAHFEAVFDIIAAELEPKPAPQTYQKFLALHGVDPKTS